MPPIKDADRYFVGKLESSVPTAVLDEGTVVRLLNARFLDGAITNAIAFDELDVRYTGKDQRIFASNTTYETLLNAGDVQLVAPLQNIAGRFLVVVISGVLFRINVDTGDTVNITPVDSYLPDTSNNHHLSFLDNDGGVYGVGGYLAIFNWPNRPIFVNQNGARLSDPLKYEMPASRLGSSGGKRVFVVSGNSILYASDPLGGANSMAPLTFEESLSQTGAYYGQNFVIGSVLDMEKVTCVARLPRYLGPNQDFLAQNLLVSTLTKKYVVAAGADRATWDAIQFISYAGSSDGIAGPLAAASIGDQVVYMSTTGRLKSIGQDREFQTGLTETFLDDPLGQYLCPCEHTFYFRDWYQTLDHSRSTLKFHKDRLFASVYPIQVPAIGKYGEKFTSPSFRALAVGSLDSTTNIGAQAVFSWEGFYTWINPIGIVNMGPQLYIVSKNEFGGIKYLRQNSDALDDHPSTIYTRGYISGNTDRATSGKGVARTLLRGALYFREIEGPIKITISMLVNDEWLCGVEGEVRGKLFLFNLPLKAKSNAWAIPLKIDLDHKGCRFELEAIRVEGEVHEDQNLRAG